MQAAFWEDWSFLFADRVGGKGRRKGERGENQSYRASIRVTNGKILGS